MNNFDAQNFARFLKRKAQKGKWKEVAETTRALSPEEIWQLMQQPELRMADNSSNIMLGQMLMVTPEDQDLHEMFELVARDQMRRAMAADDPFWVNYPPKGAVQAGVEAVELGEMPTGEAILVPCRGGFPNLGIYGITRGGKTTLLKRIVRQLISPHTCILVIERKPELCALVSDPAIKAVATVLLISELILCVCQPPPGIADEIWVPEFVRLIGVCYGRYSSQRLLLDILKRLMGERRGKLYPSLRKIAKVIANYRPGPGMREAGYKESIVWVLKDLLESSFGITDYSWSDFLPRLFSPGIKFIEASTLAVGHYLFLVCYLMRWLYVARLHGNFRSELRFIFVIEDVTSAVEKKRDWETPGGVSPLAEMTFMCRGLRMSIIYSAHSLSSISNLVLQNTEALAVLRLQGEDSRVIRNVLGTTPEQTDRIRVLEPGEIVALIPSFWPKPVYGTFEET